jgi:hypothetical protein
MAGRVTLLPVPCLRNNAARDGVLGSVDAKPLYGLLAGALCAAIAVTAASGFGSPRHPPFGQHLEPNMGPFSGAGSDAYEQVLNEILFHGHAYVRRVQMVVQPSFAGAEAVFVEGTEECEGAQTVVHVRLKEDLWGKMMETLQSACDGGAFELSYANEAAALSRLKVATDVAKAPLDCAAIDRLDEAWQAMLTDVHRGTRCSPDGDGGLLCWAMADGVRYDFATFLPSLGLADGATHSPDEGTPAARLVEIGRQLAEYTSAAPAKRASLRAELLAKADRLRDDLRQRDARDAGR